MKNLTTQLMSVDDLISKIDFMGKDTKQQLIKKIQQPLISSEKWNTYQELKAKRIDGILTEIERQKLIDIYSKIEEANSERLLNLVELSKLTGKSVRGLMKKFKV